MTSEKNPYSPKRIRMTQMEKEQLSQQSQDMSLSLPAESLETSRRTNWDAVTPFVSDALPLVSPPPRLRPIPKPSDIMECRPNDIERLSLPVLTLDDLANDPSTTPRLPLNIIPRSRPGSELFSSRRSHSSRNVSGSNKRTRPTENRYDNGIFKSATLQYPGISGKTIYADPVMAASEICADTNELKESIYGNKKDSEDQDESFYFPAPRFTEATRSALPHVLQLSD